MKTYFRTIICTRLDPCVVIMRSRQRTPLHWLRFPRCPYSRVFSPPCCVFFVWIAMVLAILCPALRLLPFFPSGGFVIWPTVPLVLSLALLFLSVPSHGRFLFPEWEEEFQKLSLLSSPAKLWIAPRHGGLSAPSVSTDP